MNLRNIKLKLTTELINRQNERNILSSIKDLMSQLKEEAGRLLDQGLINIKDGENGISKQQYALRYEHCTINVDVLWNKTTREQCLYRFDLH